ncbi:MAG: hypothetical protein NWE89_11715 [Candidatus Bathyarchaeota archaeon]|nr:hypothetical protein [Candidatus Bathyarchaeota archaeon]
MPTKRAHVKPWSRRYLAANQERTQDPQSPMARVSGRTRAVMLLEDLLGKRNNLLALDKALQAEFDADAAKFFRVYVMPFIPREAKLEVSRHPIEIHLVVPER